jgi:thiamine-monophosphate kinase
MSALSEFELVGRHLRKDNVRGRADVVLGNGDDAAILRLPPQCDLVVSTDTLVAGVHFPPAFSPADLGYRCLAVSLSDLAAMGAAPAWALLALTLPAAEDAWMEAFAGGFFELADSEQLELVGGNISRGPLSITVTVHGQLPKGQGLRRSGACAGDWIFVTGSLGEARLALDWLDRMDELTETAHRQLYRRYARPTPRLAAGRMLRPLASSCIDISDGLAADLGHLLEASGVGADLCVEDLPLSPMLMQLADARTAQSHALTGGDDYELCFTLPPAYADRTEAIAAQSGCKLTAIGQIRAGRGLRVLRRDGSELDLAAPGYRHF